MPRGSKDFAIGEGKSWFREKIAEAIPEYTLTGLDVTAALLKLCERHAPEEVVQHAKNWVVFMEKCIALGAHIDGGGA